MTTGQLAQLTLVACEHSSKQREWFYQETWTLGLQKSLTNSVGCAAAWSNCSKTRNHVFAMCDWGQVKYLQTSWTKYLFSLSLIGKIFSFFTRWHWFHVHPKVRSRASSPTQNHRFKGFGLLHVFPRMQNFMQHPKFSWNEGPLKVGQVWCFLKPHLKSQWTNDLYCATKWTLLVVRYVFIFQLLKVQTLY